MENRGNHVLGQHTADLHTELGGRNLLLSLIEERDLLLGLIVDDAAVSNQFQRIDDDMLYLAEVGTIAHVLHNVILTVLEHDQTLLVEANDVTRAIDGLGIGLVQRVLHKGGSRLFRIIVVAHGQGSASHTELALDPRFTDQPIVIIEDQHVCIPTGIADGEWFLVRDFPVNNIIGAVECDLYRAIQVGEGHLGQMTVPVVILLGGEHLAGEPHRTQALQPEGREQVHIGDVHHDRRHPEEEVHLMLLQHLEDLCRESRQMGRQHH